MDDHRRASARYGFADRRALHAWRIRVAHPAPRAPLEVVAPLPPPFARLVEAS